MRTVASNYLLSYYQTCLEAGASADELLPLIHGGEAAMSTPDLRLPAEWVTNILAKTEQLTGNLAIGLLAGKGFRPSTFLDVGHAIMFCRSLRHAILINRRYQIVTQQLGRSNIKIQGKQAWLLWESSTQDPELARNVTDAVMASHAQFGRWLSWVHDKNIIEMHFRHKETSYANKYEELFECPIKFEQEQDAMVVDVEAIDMPLPQANEEMLTIVCQRLDRALLKIESKSSWRDMVSSRIKTSLAQGVPSLETIALQMTIGGRTLRRNLSNEFTSFSIVLQDTRREMCDQFLAQNRLSLAEIAEQLGYSQQSSFNRAFKNWYGETPKAYTQALKTFEVAFKQLAP